MTSVQSSIPIIVYGKSPVIAEKVGMLLAPEYDVVATCLLDDNLSALTEIPAALRGEDIVPRSGEGSNISRGTSDLRLPRGVVFGGGISEKHAEEVQHAAAEAGIDITTVKWIHVRNPTDIPPSSDELAKKTRQMLHEAGL